MGVSITISMFSFHAPRRMASKDSEQAANNAGLVVPEELEKDARRLPYLITYSRAKWGAVTAKIQTLLFFKMVPSFYRMVPCIL